MARLGATMIKGYYPFPKHLIPHVAKWLSVSDPANTVVFDPCAGEGEAVEALTRQFNIPAANTLCAELDEARAGTCASRGLNTVIGDSLHEIHVPSCSLQWLNPPYDDDPLSGKRLETLFLGRLGQKIARGGVLAFIVPFKILAKDEFQGFPNSYKHIKILRFPDADDRFGQCVVLATRMPGKTEFERLNWQEQLKNPRSLLDPPQHLYAVPGVEVSDHLKNKFYSEFLTQAAMEKLCATPEMAAVHEVRTVFKNSRLKTLMPLRSGHQALVLATGAFDGAYKDPESGNTLCLLGSTKIVEQEKIAIGDDASDDKRVVRVMPKSQVTGWDLTASLETGESQLFYYV